MASRSRAPGTSAKNATSTDTTSQAAGNEIKVQKRSFFSRAASGSSKNSTKRNSTSSTGSNQEGENSAKKHPEGIAAKNTAIGAAGKGKTDSSSIIAKRRVPSFLTRGSKNSVNQQQQQQQQQQTRPISPEITRPHVGPDPHVNPRFQDVIQEERSPSVSRKPGESNSAKIGLSPAGGSDSAISTCASTSSISAGSFSKMSSSTEDTSNNKSSPVRKDQPNKPPPSPIQPPQQPQQLATGAAKKSSIPTLTAASIGRPAAFSPPPQAAEPSKQAPAGQAPKPDGSSYAKNVPYPPGFVHSKRIPPPDTPFVSVELWEKTCKKLATLTKTVQSLTLALDKKEAEMVAFGNDRKLEENRLNEALVAAKQESSDWQQRCVQSQGEMETVRRNLINLQEQWDAKERKLLDEHQEKMNKMTLSIARQQDTFEQKFNLLEKTQREVEESHSRACAALKMHHAKELQDVTVKQELIMKSHIRQLEERMLRRGERLDRNLAVVEQSLQERLKERDQIVNALNALRADFDAAHATCGSVEKTSGELESNLANLRQELERLKRQAAAEICEVEQRAREETESEVEARRREYSMSLNAMKSASRDVLDGLAKQFRPLAYSCQCPQRVAVRGAQLCLTCIARRICDKDRKEEEAWKRRDKEIAAKQAEWAERERQWKEKEESLNKRLKDAAERLKTKEDESAVLRREAASNRENLDKTRREADSLRSEVKTTRNRIAELQENLKTESRMSTKLMDLEKEYDAAKQDLATKEGDLHCLEKLRHDLEARCSDAETRLHDAESKRRDVENKNALLSEERDQLVKKLERLEAEREELVKAKRCDVCEREDEFKFIQQALEEALQERELIQERFEKEFEAIRTMSSDKEQQMMEDFEWKLREIEREYKRKMEEKDREAEEKLKHVRETVQEELSLERKEVEEQKRIAEEQLNQVTYLKSYEPELRQLQGLVHEQQKALRFCYHACDKLKSNETNLLEELKKARLQLEQWRSKKAVPEEKVQEALQKLRNQLNTEWEEKLKSECARLKCEMDQLHLEEKRLAMEGIRAQNERHIQTLQETWQKERTALQAQIDDLTEKLKEGERCVSARTAENSALKLLSASVEGDSLSDSAELSEPESSGDEDQKDLGEKFHLAPERPDLRNHYDKATRDKLSAGRPGKFDAVAISELAKAAVEEAAIREAAAKAKTVDILRAHEECMAAIKKVLQEHNIPWDSLNLGSPFASVPGAPPNRPPQHVDGNDPTGAPGNNLLIVQQKNQQQPAGVVAANRPKTLAAASSSNSSPTAVGSGQVPQTTSDATSAFAFNSYRDYDGELQQQRRHQLSPSPANLVDDSSR